MDLSVGRYAGSSGTYELGGTGSLSVGWYEYVGHSGTGRFLQTGGTHTVNPVLYLGYNAGSTGTLVMNPGARIDRNGLRLYYLNGGEPKELFGGDANLSGDVDVMDLCTFANHFGGPDPAWAQGDFNGDGAVDVLDLAIFANHFGKTTGGGAPVPEPAAAAIILLGLLAGGRGRRRGAVRRARFSEHA